MNDKQPISDQQPGSDFDARLLDLHLGSLSDADSKAMLQQISADARLSAQHDTLTDVFRILNNLKPIDPPANLTDRIMQRVQSQAVASAAPAASPRIVRPMPDNQSGSDGDRVIRLHSLRDVLAVAAMVVLAVGVGVPSMLAMRERNQRTACAWNLAQVGRGVQSYATTFGDSLPFVGWADNASWKPSSEPGVATIPNRRHVYLLLRTQQVPSEAFVCPSSKDVAMPAAQVGQHNDFLESRNISYAGQNMAGVRPSLRSDPNLVIFADDNPLFDDGLPLYDLAAQRLGLRDPSQSNSRAHGGAGQNILRLDGVTSWTTSPDAGIGHDNIWTLRNVSGYTGREGPQSATDSHLLK